MRFIYKRALIVITAIFFLNMVFSVPTGTEILKKMDEMQEQATDITCKVSIVQQKVNQGIKNYEMIFYRKDKTDSFLIVFLAPEAEKGNGYLRVGNNNFLYRQNTRTFQTINRDESISGTDAKAGDFEKRKLTELYYVETNAGGKEIVMEEKLGKKDTYKITLLAKVNDVTYPKQVYWVEKDTFLPLKIQSYSLSGTLMATTYMPKWTVIDGKYIWLQSIFVDEFEKGNKSIVELSGISLVPLDDKIFTKAYLENLSK